MPTVTSLVRLLSTALAFDGVAADGPSPYVANNFWAAHILNEHFTGPANKDTGNLECDVGFVAFYCFGQQTKFSDFNSEEHVDHTVFENVYVNVNSWAQGAGS